MRPDATSWEAWDDSLIQGKTAHEALPFLDDEDIIDLLATGEPEARRYELRLFATELTNRLVRFRRLIDAAGAKTREGLQDASRSAEVADERTRETAQSVADHIEVRQDAIENEPRAAREAHTAARETREAVDELRGAEDSLSRARQEIGRTARDPDA